MAVSYIKVKSVDEMKSYICFCSVKVFNWAVALSAFQFKALIREGEILPTQSTREKNGRVHSRISMLLLVTCECKSLTLFGRT